MKPDIFLDTSGFFAVLTKEDAKRRLFLKHLDQKWSFTDCFSFWVMRTLKLRDALSADVHFRHAGFHPLLTD